MPEEPTDAESKLQKLGQRLRAGFVKQHPAPAESMEIVRNAVREQFEKEKIAERKDKGSPVPSRGERRSSPEPNRER